MTGTRAGLIAAAVATMALAAPLGAQAVPAASSRALSLEEALRLSEAASEQLEISRAGVTRARGQQLQARSERLPQISGSLSYQRALASEFEGLGGGGGADTTQTQPGPDPATCGRFAPNPALPVAERLDSLEKAVDCAANANPFAAFGDLPFGRENTWRVGLNLTQNVFTGGRVTAQNRIADAGRTVAEVALASSRAQLALDVTQAYYDAQLADRLVGIAEATLEQAERTLRQTQLARQVGNQPEFELLRAQVTRDNQRPVLIQRRADRDLAYLRLRQLLNLPLDEPVTLTTELGDAEEEAAPVERFTATETVPGDTAADARAAVRQAAESVRVQEAQLRIARSQRLPNVALSSTYGRVAYPETFALPDFLDAAENWTVSASLSVPIFTGGRIRGQEMEARAGVQEARARLQQTRELATLDARNSLQRLVAAQASYEASAGTVQQARRAYQIAEVRFAEGLSTQVELSDARLLLQQAVANRALAARDLQVARARVRLLPDLPFELGGAAAGGQQQQVPQQQRQTPRQNAADPSQAGLTGAGVQ